VRLRRPHIIIIALGAALWIALWYLAGSVVYWLFGGR